MKVSPELPFQVIYSFYEHEFLGILPESYIVQTKGNRELTLQHQTLSVRNVTEFSHGLDEKDMELVHLIDDTHPEAIIRKFHKEKIRPADFFQRFFLPKSKYHNPRFLEYIQSYIDRKIADLFDLWVGKRLFFSNPDGEPAGRELFIQKEPARVYFHFDRNEENTHYFIIIKCGDERINFQFQNAKILCQQPVWLLVNNLLYYFPKEIDGKKISPFLNKWFIEIPRSLEEEYFKKFARPLIESHKVFLNGMTLIEEKHAPIARLVFSHSKQAQTGTLFEPSAEDTEKFSPTSAPDETIIQCLFRYGNYQLPLDENKSFSVEFSKEGTGWIFARIFRDSIFEKTKITFFKQLGVTFSHATCKMNRLDFLGWLNLHYDVLMNQGIELEELKNTSSDSTAEKYFIGQANISIEVKEGNDWFDVYSTVRFGKYEIPFIELKNHILSNIREFRLPDGTVAVIPSEWFAQFGNLSVHLQEDNGRLKLKKYHVGIVRSLEDKKLIVPAKDGKMNNLLEPEKLTDIPMPDEFNGQLRHYQKTGYNWLHYLNSLKMGGFLADDMGLGKTVQTLAFLMSLYKEKEIKNASLVIMPTSLIYNWEDEARKFTPALKVMKFTGPQRQKDPMVFHQHHVIFTTYGIVRMDHDFLKKYPFNYIILDESQAIKNFSSQISQAVKNLESANRIMLTGTPIENSTSDLWSQMEFANHGFLGNFKYFNSEFVIPIEKQKNQERSVELQKMIQPFILRRTKQQVEKELPEKFEQVLFNEMSEEQQIFYDEIKSGFRNQILKSIGEKGLAQSQFILLQGLTMLRQIVNHPRMLNEDYSGDSGKFNEVCEMIENAMKEGHKVLIFSQFVKLLTILREHLDKSNIIYAYLDGNTQNRKSPVEKFQHDDAVKLFLISLKAGGLGLNLTAADYVFILDPWWNPAVEMQAINRAHRIGQDKTVFIYKFITKNSVEEKILNLQASKLKLAEDLIRTDDSIFRSLTEGDIREILD
ncbi:MAG: hypothetical protein A3H98_01095 [Bacteroidetes bacterium RIFCSPLOWO2_02_FULL_36_8]|nr:MAG: hypothetical protein A3H98_01095 [Bacteroidetes bacterium RIFCSPLOWO2_02_FULL_36_8]OFY68865.1 MAG: hypothetical protein A3G23_03505 [Bacteroidetes bacterium RIFCSPLOWO2_12_FULL_37_12]